MNPFPAMRDDKMAVQSFTKLLWTPALLVSGLVSRRKTFRIFTARFLQAECPSCHLPNSIKAPKGHYCWYKVMRFVFYLRDTVLMRYLLSSCVCPSDCLAVRHNPALY